MFALQWFRGFIYSVKLLPVFLALDKFPGLLGGTIHKPPQNLSCNYCASINKIHQYLFLSWSLVRDETLYTIFAEKLILFATESSLSLCSPQTKPPCFESQGWWSPVLGALHSSEVLSPLLVHEHIASLSHFVCRRIYHACVVAWDSWRFIFPFPLPLNPWAEWALSQHLNCPDILCHSSGQTRTCSSFL